MLLLFYFKVPKLISFTTGKPDGRARAGEAPLGDATLTLRPRGALVSVS